MGTEDAEDIFAIVERRTGKPVPPENRTPEMAEIFASLESIISTHGVTGLPNKRSLDERLQRELDRIKYAAGKSTKSTAPESPCTFIAIDLDGFKAVNDTYGHAAGDEALKYFAGKLSKILRPGDMPTHQGGDEFGAVVQASHVRADGIMERLRLAMSADPFMHDGQPVALSFSAGAHEIQASDQNVAAIKDIADKKAYDDKGGKGLRLLVERVVHGVQSRRGQDHRDRATDGRDTPRGGPTP